MTVQHWVDRAFDVNALHKWQDSPFAHGLRRLDGVVVDLQAMADLGLVIKRVQGTPVIVGWTDSSLYGACRVRAAG